VSSLAAYGLFPDSPLELVRSTLCRAVDRRAEGIRARYLTPGAGQALVYVLKAAEAAAAIVDPAPSAERFPLLQASLGLDGETLREVAVTVLDQVAIFTRVCALVETARLTGKRAITGAVTKDDAIAAFDAVQWPEGI
jgi:hypothetical protein